MSPQRFLVDRIIETAPLDLNSIIFSIWVDTGKSPAELREGRLPCIHRLCKRAGCSQTRLLGGMTRCYSSRPQVPRTERQQTGQASGNGYSGYEEWERPTIDWCVRATARRTDVTFFCKAIVRTIQTRTQWSTL